MHVTRHISWLILAGSLLVTGVASASMQTAVASTAKSPADFSITALRVEKYNAAPDYTQSKPAITAVKTGNGVYLSLYWTLNTAIDTAPHYHFTVVNGGNGLINQDYVDAQSSYGPGTYRYSLPFVVSNPGKYTVTVVLSVGTTSKRVSISFQALGPAGTIAFHFDRLLTVNAHSSQPQKVFHAGGTVGIAIRFTVANAPGTVSVQVARKYAVYSGGSWQPLGPPVGDIFDTTNGPHFRIYSLPVFHAYQKLRIRVTLQVGNHRSAKQVTVRVTA